MIQKGICQVIFIVKTVICLMDNDPILSIILFIIFPIISISRIFWVSNAPCSQLIGIMQSSHLSNYHGQLNDLFCLTLGVFIQLGTHRSKGLLQNFCQSTEYCLVAFDDVPSSERIRKAVSYWLFEETPFSEFTVWVMIDVISAGKFTTNFELL